MQRVLLVVAEDLEDQRLLLDVRHERLGHWHGNLIRKYDIVLLEFKFFKASAL